MGAADWKGYYIKFLKTGKILPHKYIQFDTLEQTPNQMEEIKAYRDDNTRDLFRFTAEGHKSVFSFKTRKNMHLQDMIDFQNYFYEAEEPADHDQQKVHIEYWNEKIKNYKTGWFYVPNLKYNVVYYTDSDIVYAEQLIDFIEY